MTVAAVIAWIGIGQQVIAAGRPIWDELKAFLAERGIDIEAKDNAILDADIADADVRKARALADATGTP